MSDKPYSVKTLARDVHIIGKTCFDCNRYPLGYMGDTWNCRASGFPTGLDEPACGRWLPRQPKTETPAFSQEALALVDAVLARAKKPDPPPPRFKPTGLLGCVSGVVYFLKCRNLVKIGVTVSMVMDRIHSMRGSNPFELSLLGLVPGGLKVEREAHVFFRQHLYRREWFKFDDAGLEDMTAWIIDHGGELYHGCA